LDRIQIIWFSYLIRAREAYAFIDVILLTGRVNAYRKTTHWKQQLPLPTD